MTDIEITKDADSITFTLGCHRVTFSANLSNKDAARAIEAITNNYTGSQERSVMTVGMVRDLLERPSA
ncbi:hypothetical protein LRP31_25500 [Mesorhizobium mediterraneum]|uniref:Uncharacterized protein n=1 Tax=Mesorhizobium mediterraneum TaxID=43617 RepID=A0AB36R7X0_9HYPH|nr:hypothetical protein [Mesorhizobium mediterraneum]PAQ00916.1 hypothetical protein CIT25_17775 [Mesorhizobium mediterraneum]WIW52378.1 hypothetical protein LRP31_25500 [Mesorhizobium mediterraneum]